ncbi:uncharacterized protein OCT59_026024 [Rhizophagus irregularis]|uniref:uncharacterized protein n=1 Tax=Rhizophagus irregularis TaxID=588596 RepID=UPI003324FE46|nr:hypothetical protein OCT59_026024 [Rhizophagus irregularis]
MVCYLNRILMKSSISLSMFFKFLTEINRSPQERPINYFINNRIGKLELDVSTFLNCLRGQHNYFVG